jgi:signal transduction histidine kinase
VEHGSTSSRASPDDAPEPGDRSVTVTVGDLSDGSGFYVADDGPGIPEAERERVVDTGYSTSENGTGFGLSIVTEVAEAHGWELTLTESDDGGARFEIRGVETVADDDVSPA